MREVIFECVGVVLAFICLEFEMMTTEQKLVCHLDSLCVETLYMVRGLKVGRCDYQDILSRSFPSLYYTCESALLRLEVC